MKVYERYETPEYDYPDDMAKILKYLNEHGKVMVSGATIEKLYREFSDRADAGWLGVDDYWLAEFEDWLNDYEF